MPEEFLDPNAAPPLEPQVPEDAPQAEMSDIKGAGMGQVMPNPLEEPDEPASPEEQKEYKDIFKRLIAMVHDTKEADGKKSMADSIIKSLSNSEIPAHEVIGQTAGNLVRMFDELSKRNKKKWNGDALREAGMDLVTELIDVARVTGAQKKLPPDESKEGEDFYQACVLEAAKVFGDYLLSTKQADVQGEQEAYKEQMEREATSGALDDWNMQDMAPQQLEAGLAQMKGICIMGLNWAAGLGGVAKGLEGLGAAMEKTDELEYRNIRDKNLRRFQLEDQAHADKREDMGWERDDTKQKNKETREDENLGIVPESDRGGKILEREKEQEKKKQEDWLARIKAQGEARKGASKKSGKTKAEFIRDHVMAAEKRYAEENGIDLTTLKSDADGNPITRVMPAGIRAIIMAQGNDIWDSSEKAGAEAQPFADPDVPELGIVEWDSLKPEPES